jgi:hypothetical protein
MPDKIDKYVIDSELVDKGWKQMQQMLDKEMPERKKVIAMPRKFFWTFSIAASVLLAGFFVFKEQKADVSVATESVKTTNTSNIETVEKSAQISSEKLKNSNIRTSNNANASNLIGIPNHNLPIEDKNTLTKGITPSPKTNSYKSQNRQFDAVSSSILNDNAAQIVASERNVEATTDAMHSIENIENSNESNSNVNDKTTTTNPNDKQTEAQDAAVAKTNSIPLRSTLALTPQLASPLVKIKTKDNAPEVELTKASVATKLHQKIRHGVFGRINYTGIIDNGYTFGYINQYNIQKRHHLQTRLYAERNSRVAHVITETFIMPKALIEKSSTSSANVIGDTVISQIVYPFYIQCGCSTIARQNNIPSSYTEFKNEYVIANSWHLGIAANYSYRLSPRWELSSGVGLSYAIKSLEYAFIIKESGFSKSYNIFNDPSTPVGTVTTNEAFSNLGVQQNIFSRWDGFWEFGANFYVNKRFSLGASYRKGFIDITKNDALNIKEYNNALTMQSIFFF